MWLLTRRIAAVRIRSVRNFRDAVAVGGVIRPNSIAHLQGRPYSSLVRPSSYYLAQSADLKTPSSASILFHRHLLSRTLSDLTTQQDKSRKSDAPPLLGLNLKSDVKPSILPSNKDKSKEVKQASTTHPSSKLTSAKLENTQPVAKPTLLRRIWNEIVHYYHGFRLLGLEMKIALGICFRVLRGKTLTLRERKQLVRTFADIIRLVPFAVFIIVPFMELLLPVYLKFFPFMLPSTFKEKGQENERARQRLKAKLELTRFLQETLIHATESTSDVQQTPTVAEFQDFLRQVQQSGQLAAPEDIVRFSKLFEDQITLDSLDHHHLKMLCQVLGLSAIGPSNLLRFQLWMRVRHLKAEDRLLAKEGIEHIPPWELQSLSQDRGMRSAGLSEERLRTQLSQWLELHLEKNVPITLLLFSRALHVSESTLNEQLLQNAIASLPDTASAGATMRAVEATPATAVDPKVKIDALRKEQAGIQAERLQRQKEEVKQKAAEAAEIPSTELLTDKAPAVEDLHPTPELLDKAPAIKPEKVVIPTDVVSPPPPVPDMIPHACEVERLEPLVEPSIEKVKPEVEPVISAGDLAQIGSAIADLSEPHVLDGKALGGLKEQVAETAKIRQKRQAAAVTTTPVDKRVSKAASRLENRVDKLIKEMDTIVGKLSSERAQLLKDIELREVHVKEAEEESKKTEILDALQADQDRLIDINDLLQALRRIQKVPDDARWQRILEVLDEDHDGKIDLHHVLSVIEFMGSRDVKLGAKDMTRILEMIDQEELAAELEEPQKTDQTVKAKPDAAAIKDKSADSTNSS